MNTSALILTKYIVFISTINDANFKFPLVFEFHEKTRQNERLRGTNGYWKVLSILPWGLRFGEFVSGFFLMWCGNFMPLSFHEFFLVNLYHSWGTFWSFTGGWKWKRWYLYSPQSWPMEIGHFWGLYKWDIWVSTFFWCFSLQKKRVLKKQRRTTPISIFSLTYSCWCQIQLRRKLCFLVSFERFSARQKNAGNRKTLTYQCGSGIWKEAKSPES